jgi:phosphoglycolate phosphatase
MTLKAILFDKDGTLLDFDKTWGEAGYSVMRHMSSGDEDAFNRLVALTHYNVAERRYEPPSHMIASSSSEHGLLWADALGRADREAVIEEIDTLFMAEAQRRLVPIGNPLEVITTLIARGYKIGIATNDGEAAALQQAEILGLVPHLDYIVGHDSGHGSKPHPGMVTAFITRFGYEPHEVALVGDSTHDLHAARAAGAVGIAVLSGPAGHDDLAPHADHVIPSINELVALIDSL